MERKTSKIKEVKTRKVHVCDSCKKSIPTGNIAINASGIAFDDDNKCIPYNFYFCQKCMEEADNEALEGVK
jgi:hypothetical protein